MDIKEQKKFVEELLHTSGESFEVKDETWEVEPVNPTTFFKDFVHEPCYPHQQTFVDRVLGTQAKEWNSEYTEGIALIGKGGGKDRTIAKILTYAIYKLLCMRNPQRFFGAEQKKILA